LQVPHCRAADAEMVVTPVPGVLGVTHPDVRDTDPTAESDASIDHHHLAVGPVVETPQVVPA